MIQETNKPIAELTGQNGNIFNLISIANRALRKKGGDVIKEMDDKIRAAGSYDEAIQIIMQYCEVC